jgi:hypothetical protein
MAKFEINTLKVSVIHLGMPAYTTNINSYISGIESIKNNLAINASSSEVVKNSLGRTIESLQSQSIVMNELATNLLAICNKYRETENIILDNGVLADFAGIDIDSMDKEQIELPESATAFYSGIPKEGSLWDKAINNGAEIIDRVKEEGTEIWGRVKEEGTEYILSALKKLGLTDEEIEALEYFGTDGIIALITQICNGDLKLIEWFKDYGTPNMKSYVPNNVSDEAILALFKILTIVNPVDDETRASHKEHNITAWEKYKVDHPNEIYIEDQNYMNDANSPIIYGSYYGEYNACEVIAAYNALVALNGGESPEDFPELLNYFEGNGIVLGGEFGTSPDAVNTYFQNNGYDTKMISGKEIKSSTIEKMQDKYDTYILTTYNDSSDLTAAVHTISITKNEDGKYVMHNAGDATEYETLEEAIGAYNGGISEPISIIGVKNK